MAYSKYGNKTCYLHKISLQQLPQLTNQDNPLVYYRFDSELERQVYLDLLDYQTVSNDAYVKSRKPFRITLRRQVKIDLLDWNLSSIEISHIVDFSLELSVRFSSIDTWVDDTIGYKIAKTYYIEAKGVPTEVALIKWKLLEAKHRYFELGEYFAVGNTTAKKPRQAIQGHYITSVDVALKAITKSISSFVDAYECINGIR